MAWFAEELQSACATDLKAENEVATSSLLGAFLAPYNYLSHLTAHPRRSANLLPPTSNRLPGLQHDGHVLLRLRAVIRGAPRGRLLLHAPARDRAPELERPELLGMHAADHVRFCQPGPEHERPPGDVRGRGAHHEQGLRVRVRAGDGGAEQRGGREGPAVVCGARCLPRRRAGRRRRGVVVLVVGRRANPSGDTDTRRRPSSYTRILLGLGLPTLGRFLWYLGLQGLGVEIRMLCCVTNRDIHQSRYPQRELTYCTCGLGRPSRAFTLSSCLLQR